LLRDLTVNLGAELRGRRILLLGAGGAARGALEPLLGARPSRLVIANRTPDRASRLAAEFADLGPLEGCGFDAVHDAYDLVINATSASLGGQLPPIAAATFSDGGLAYDMMYGREETPFLAFARANGVSRLADGLGMLVEQAAEAFLLWRGVRPQSPPVLAELRRLIAR
jgi:shikimate dehydrogenase